MTTFIVTEFDEDANLVRERLTQEWERIEVVGRGTRMAAISYAKTISVNYEEPAVVVLSALSENEDVLQIMRSEFEDLVSPLPFDIAPVLILGAPSIADAIDGAVMDEINSFLTGAPLESFRYVPRP
jgi:hypothetical protein